MKRSIFPICNGRPERAPVIAGHTFILCWRCSMVCFGALIMVLFLCFLKDSISCKTRILGGALCIPMLIDGIRQYIFNSESNNFLRAFTGLLFGFGIVFLFY